jgi:hypothetical protein
MARTVPPSSPVAVADPAPASDIPRLDVDSITATAAPPMPAPAAARAVYTKGINVSFTVISTGSKDNIDSIGIYVDDHAAARITEEYIDINNKPTKYSIDVYVKDVYNYIRTYIRFALLDPNVVKFCFTPSFMPRVTLTRERMESSCEEVIKLLHDCVCSIYEQHKVL